MDTHAPELTISERMIERWHENPVNKAGKRCELHEYLGLTWEEYGESILNPPVFDKLVRSRNPEYVSYVFSRTSANIETVQDAYKYLANAAEDSSSIAVHLSSDVEDALDERMCILILGRINEYAKSYPTDEGYDFDIYHDLRLLKQAYSLLLGNLRGGF